MENESQLQVKKIKEEFKKYLEDNEIVCVGHFYEKLESENNLLPWPKFENPKNINFTSATENCNANELEVLAEGFRCLAQIYINLLKDFDIFKKFPIREYSGAYQYISKVDSFEEILSAIGYKEIPEKLHICLDPNLKAISDRDNAIETAVHLLLCYMEISELIKLKYQKCTIKELIDLRKAYIQDKMKNEKYTNLSDEAMLKLFENCEICSGNMDLKTGKCEICGHSVEEFSIAFRFVDFIKKQFNLTVIVKFPEEETSFKQQLNDFKTSNFEVEMKTKSETQTRDTIVVNNWTCGRCTYINQSTSNQCEICLEINPRITQ